ncbi:MAG: arginase family protein [Tagaea sp.]
MSFPARLPIPPPVLAGIPSFLGARIADIERIGPSDIALVGLFLDHGGRAGFGARFSARQIRYAWAETAVLLPPDTLARCVDLGDLNVFPLEPERQEAAFRRQIGAIAKTGAIPVIVGGRPLEAPLGTYAGLERTVKLGEADSAERLSTRIALLIDLAESLNWRSPTGAFGRVAETISRLPAGRIGAVHVTGVAPELDVDGRQNATFAAGILATLVRVLAGSRACP